MPATEIGDAAEPKVLASALARDIADTARRMGVRSVRASIVDLATMNLGLAWNFADSTPSLADSTFSTTPSSFSGLFDTLPGESLVRRLSPRRWAFAWRLDAEQAVFGEAHFVERQDELGPTETTLLRLVCDSGIRSISVPDKDDDDKLRPQPERSARARATGVDHVLLGCAALAAVLSGWLLLATLPQWRHSLEGQAERIGRLEQRADATVSNRLAVALATGDYGEVQTELASLQSLGYFGEALVSNARHRVVASAGSVVGQPIGSEIDPQRVQGQRRLPLLIGSQVQGDAWLAEPPLPPLARGDSSTSALAAGALAASALTTVLLLGRLLAPSAWRARLSRLGEGLRKRNR